MKKFNDDTEKIEFLRKYKLISETSTDSSGFYYFYPESDIPVECEVIGCEDVFETWACVVIRTKEKEITIHSDYLSDMKKRGRAFRKNLDADAYIVFDLETTGLNYKQDEIIEIAAVKCSGQKVHTFSELVKPNTAIPENITKLTGITDEMVQNADSIDNVLPKFLEFIGGCKLVGHNIKTFDILFLNRACRNLGLPEVKNELIDTLPLAKKVLPELANHKMATICEHYGIDASGAHRALEDCYMCSECYKLLAESSPEPPAAEISSADLAEDSFQVMVLSLLQEIITALELPERGLILQKNGGKTVKTSSVYINEPPYPATEADLAKINTTQSILKFEEKENNIILTVRSDAFSDTPCPEDVSYKSQAKTADKQMPASFVTVFFPSCHPELASYIKKIIQYRVKHYISSADSFGCCTRFEECSDAMKCVHENKLFSTACTYRRNLDNGRIFYGKNRNVDGEAR